MIESIDAEVCTECELCVAACPLDVLRMADSDAGFVATIAYPEDCMTCFACELCCPVDAIRVHPFKEVIASPLYPVERAASHA